MTFALRTHVDAVITRLEAETGKQAGRAEAPSDETLPYMVVYPLPSAERDGDLKDYDSLQTWVFQITSLGGTAEQAEWMADQARTALVGTDTLTVTGRSIQRVESDTIGGTPVRDPAGQTQVFTLPESFRVLSYPS